MLTVSPAETVKLGAEIGFDGSCGPYAEMVREGPTVARGSAFGLIVRVPLYIGIRKRMARRGEQSVQQEGKKHLGARPGCSTDRDGVLPDCRCCGITGIAAPVVPYYEIHGVVHDAQRSLCVKTVRVYG